MNAVTSSSDKFVKFTNEIDLLPSISAISIYFGIASRMVDDLPAKRVKELIIDSIGWMFGRGIIDHEKYKSLMAEYGGES